MARIVKWLAEFMALLVGAGAWGMELWGQKIAGHEADWKIIAITASIAFVVLVFLHIFFLNSELGEFKEKRADISIIFEKKPPMYSRVDHWYRVLIKNHSKTASADGVDVKLVDIDPLPPDISDIVFPTSLGAKDKPSPIGIPPDDEWTFDVVTDYGAQVRFWTKIKRPNDSSPYPGITTRLVVDQIYRVTIAATLNNPRRRDRNGDARVFILHQPTGNVGDLEFYEETAGAP